MKRHFLSAGLAATVMLALGTQTANASALQRAVAVTERELGATAFESELYREDGRRLVEVELLRGNEILEVVFDAESRQIIESEIYRNQRVIDRTDTALQRTELSLIDAIKIARETVGRGAVEEADLRVTGNQKSNGRRFVVDMRNRDGEFEVKINARNRNVIRVVRDD